MRGKRKRARSFHWTLDRRTNGTIYLCGLGSDDWTYQKLWKMVLHGHLDRWKCTEKVLRLNIQGSNFFPIGLHFLSSTRQARVSDWLEILSTNISVQKLEQGWHHSRLFPEEGSWGSKEARAYLSKVEIPDEDDLCSINESLFCWVSAQSGVSCKQKYFTFY